MAEFSMRTWRPVLPTPCWAPAGTRISIETRLSPSTYWHVEQDIGITLVFITRGDRKDPLSDQRVERGEDRTALPRRHIDSALAQSTPANAGRHRRSVDPDRSLALIAIC